MAVKRIVANIAANDVSKARLFYEDVLELDIAMDMGWISTYTNNKNQTCQISIASEGGSNTPVPDLSIEVDNLDEVYQRVQQSDFDISYELIEEPWGVRRFYVTDPFGKLLNILEHSPTISESSSPESSGSESPK